MPGMSQAAGEEEEQGLGRGDRLGPTAEEDHPRSRGSLTPDRQNQNNPVSSMTVHKTSHDKAASYQDFKPPSHKGPGNILLGTGAARKGCYGDTDAKDGDRSKGKKPKELSVIQAAESSVISVEIREKKPKPGGMGAAETQDSGIYLKEPSFYKTVHDEAKKVEKEMGFDSRSPNGLRKKKMKKGIFISYSPDAGFIERKFVTETVRQLKENNLAEDIWFDKDEGNTDNPCWFSYRLEGVEKCRAAVCFLSSSYFSCPVSAAEGRTLIERQMEDLKTVQVYLVQFSDGEELAIPNSFSHLLPTMVDLTNEANGSLSLAEKSSVVVGSLMMNLEKHASMHLPPQPQSPPYSEPTGEYRQKKMCQWSVADLQEWMFQLGIKEFYRQSLAENAVDGFLLMSLTDQDLAQQLCIDSRVVRRKMMQQILVNLNKEHKIPETWHLRARTQRSRPGTVYLVYDPADVRLAQNIKKDLVKRGLQVIHHDKLGQSKEEFLQLNGPQMALATFALIVMTDHADTSPFVFHEVLFADWLGKKLVSLIFKNKWTSLRPSLKAVLGDRPAVDFEQEMYQEGLDILEHHVKPPRSIPGVILEQAYLHKVVEGLKPFQALATAKDYSITKSGNLSDRKVLISYQRDMESRVEDIRRALETSGFSCCLASGGQRGKNHSSLLGSLSSRSAPPGSVVEGSGDSRMVHIQSSMKASSVVLCCTTQKYLLSDHCTKDLLLAESLHKPILPAMLRFCPWPPDGTPSHVRKILGKLAPVDLSNDKMYKQNITTLVERVKKLIRAR